jgi:tryptophan synthase alpha subunit
VGEDLLEAEAIEEPAGPEGADPAESVRQLPDRRAASELSVWRGDVRTAAIAAAGGIVVGAATVAAVRATRAAAQPKRRLARKAKERMPGVVASRSFMIDIHLLDR